MILEAKLRSNSDTGNASSESKHAAHLLRLGGTRPIIESLNPRGGKGSNPARLSTSGSHYVGEREKNLRHPGPLGADPPSITRCFGLRIGRLQVPMSAIKSNLSFNYVSEHRQKMAGEEKTGHHEVDETPLVDRFSQPFS